MKRFMMSLDLSAKAEIFLGKERLLKVKEGDYLCLFSAGSYGFVMSSNYNSRPGAPEIMMTIMFI